MLTRTLIITCAVTALAVGGCSSTRNGKCRTCGPTSIYPSDSNYDTYSPSPYSTPHSYPSEGPAPMPAAEPLPGSSSGDSLLPPPPPEAVRARPINQISASTRSMYGSVTNAVRNVFSR